MTTTRKDTVATSKNNLPPRTFVPFAPLWRIARVESDLPDAADFNDGTVTLFGLRWLSDLTGIHADTLSRYRRWDRITLAAADRCAVAIGRHPVEIWGDLWIDDDELARCAALGPRAYDVFTRLASEVGAV